MKTKRTQVETIPVPIKWMVTAITLTIFTIGVLTFFNLKSTPSINQLSSQGQYDASYAGGQYSGGTDSSGGTGSSAGAGGSGGSCCGGGGAAGGSGGSGGGGCGAGSGPPKSPEQLNSVKVEAIKWYAQKYGDLKVDGEVSDRGCHVEIIITKNGKPIKYLSFKNGSFSELS